MFAQLNWREHGYFRSRDIGNRAFVSKHCLVPFKFDHVEHLVAGIRELLAASDIGKIDDETAFNDFSAKLLDQAASGECCSACGDQVVNQ